MAFRLPRLPRNVPLVGRDGAATQIMQRWFQSTVEAIEDSSGSGVEAREIAEMGVPGENNQRHRFDAVEALQAPFLPTSEPEIDGPLMPRPFAPLKIGTGLALDTGTKFDGSAPLTLTNSAPDQTVTLTSGGGCTITGTYPNFTITVP